MSDIQASAGPAIAASSGSGADPRQTRAAAAVQAAYVLEVIRR